MTVEQIISELKDNIKINVSEEFEEGFFDSLEIMALVENLEENFNCSIKGSDIIPENFLSIETIKTMVIHNGGVI